MADKATIMKEAQKYVLKGQIDKAIAEWEKLIREAPDGNTYNIIGDLCLKKGDKKGAVDYLHKSANFFRQDGFSLKALALYKKVLNINPADTDALNALGQLSEEKGLITDAIKYYLAIADCFSKDGKKDELLDIYSKILSLSPSNVPLRVKVAEIFLREGLASYAAQEYVAIARSYEEQEDYQKAQEFYEKTLALKPSNKEAVLGLAELLESSGDLEGALSHIRPLVSALPEDPQVLLKYADLSKQAGRGADAEEILARLRDSDPSNISVRRMLGDVYLGGGREEEAWQEYIPVIDRLVADEEYDTAIHLLDLFRKIDPVETGKRLIAIFTKTNDDDRLVTELIGLGELYGERGLEEEAKNCFRNAAEVRPYDEELQRRVRQMTAGPEPEVAPGPAFHEEKDTIAIVSGSEKSAEEIFVETDIFSRYGLVHEAVKLLEGLKLREPHNADVHVRLKALYSESDDKESAVTECLILNELYKRQGDLAAADRELQDAVNILPTDPRLQGRVKPPADFEPGVFTDESAALTGDEVGAIEDYEDALAEADFYMRQGLIQEASKILERMHLLFPGNKDITDRLEGIGHIAEPLDVLSSSGTSGITAPGEEAGPPGEETAGPGYWEAGEETHSPEAAGAEPEPPGTSGEISAEGKGHVGEVSSAAEELAEERPAGAAAPEQEAQQEEYEDILLTEQDLLDAQEMPELSLDNDVLEIFQEFKKGLEKELGDEDSETHYNLGIAYKEMGLVEDAIKEFQSSREDPKRFVQSSTMLGVCYMEKGLYSLAIDVLRQVADEVTENDDSYWPVRYDLAEAYEKNNNLKEALELYTSVYGWNARFRGVSEKVSKVKAQMGKGGEEKPKTRKDRVSYL